MPSRQSTGLSCGTTTVVVPELGGTTTVVALADGGGLLLTQPASIAPSSNKLDKTFIFVSLFDSGLQSIHCRPKSVIPDRGLSRMYRALIAHVYVVDCPTPRVGTAFVIDEQTTSGYAAVFTRSRESNAANHSGQ